MSRLRRLAREGVGSSPLSQRASASPLRIPKISLPESLSWRRSPRPSKDDSGHNGSATTYTRRKSYEIATEAARAAAAAAHAPAAEYRWRSTTMQLQLPPHYNVGAELKQLHDEREARWKVRRARHWWLSRVQMRRRPPPVTDDQLRPILPEANLTLRRRTDAMGTSVLRPLSSFAFTGAVGGAPTSSAPAGAFHTVSVVGASAPRRRVTGESSEIVKARATERCRIIFERFEQEPKLHAWWKRSFGDDAVGIEAEIARLRATQTASLALFNYQESLRTAARLKEEREQEAAAREQERGRQVRARAEARMLDRAAAPGRAPAALALAPSAPPPPILAMLAAGPAEAAAPSVVEVAAPSGEEAAAPSGDAAGIPASSKDADPNANAAASNGDAAASNGGDTAASRI